MIAVIQRASEASVKVDGVTLGQISKGVVVFLGIEVSDDKQDITWLANKIINLRIFNDEQGVMNKSLFDTNGGVLLISQFTLHASTKKGNRPSYIKAAKPDIAIPLYERFIKEIDGLIKTQVQTGRFGADMQVSLINDGPVTIIIDTKDKK